MYPSLNSSLVLELWTTFNRNPASVYLSFKKTGLIPVQGFLLLHDDGGKMEGEMQDRRRGIKRNPCMIENASFLWSCDGRTSTVEHRLEDHSVMAEFLAQADPLERENMFLEWRWCTLLLGIYLYERERERRTARKRSKIEISRRTWRWFFRDLERKNGVVRCKEREGKNLSPPWHCWWRWNIESKCRVMIYLLLARTKKGEERKLNSIIFNVKIILIRFLFFFAANFWQRKVGVSDCNESVEEEEA